MQSVYVVVVTHNRRVLLERCLAALGEQTSKPTRVLVIDNASTDGTGAWLGRWMAANLASGELVTLGSNLGGAGGFEAGLRKACEEGASWVWMMDDDACPHRTAMEELLKVASRPSDVYGSLAISGNATSWPMTLMEEGRTTNRAEDVPTCARVASLPLLGFLIHRSLVQRIGYPDAGFFIAADDIEYCLRARKAGADIFVAGQSRIEHPRTEQKTVSFLGARVTYLSLAPWKRYYDTRNRLLIAHKYYGVRLLTETIPGSCVRLYAALRYEPRKLMQLWAWCCGMLDGLLGIKGKRHGKWGIRP